MAAMKCLTCGACWGLYVDSCRICDNKPVYRKDLEADTLSRLKEIEDLFLQRQSREQSAHAVDGVFNWRFECLLEAGAPPEVAELVAGRRVDLHEACEVFRAGCDPQLAQEILNPVE